MPITAEILRHYPNFFFVETGTHVGDGVQAAWDAGCFARIYSIEALHESAVYSKRRFAQNEWVRIVEGISTEIIPLIAQIVDGYIHPDSGEYEEKITWWLDAHHSGDGTAGSYDYCPLLDELAILVGRGEDTILIDDMRLWAEGQGGVTQEKIYAALKAINPNFKLELIDSPHAPLDILVARP